MSVKRITEKDRAVRQSYAAAAPKQLGNLHERMKYLIDCAQRCELYRLDSDTWHAIWDLELEISFHEPATPPFSRRAR